MFPFVLLHNFSIIIYFFVNYRDRIIEEIENHRVIVIEGETGCGKSTQVPQIIFDHYIKNLRGSECNIIVAEPRRISALALADWVAKERYEAVSQSLTLNLTKCLSV